MNWNEAYRDDREPSMSDIKEFLREAEPLWSELTSYIEEIYQVKPQFSYSKCSAQPGWNVKYKKSGKSLCTLYPMEDSFIALVVVGAKEEAEVDITLQAGMFTPYLKELIQNTPFAVGGKWLMVRIKDKAVMEDVKLLLEIRVKVKK